MPEPQDRILTFLLSAQVWLETARMMESSPCVEHALEQLTLATGEARDLLARLEEAREPAP